jgi:hemolysin activation/secretion protein
MASVIRGTCRLLSTVAVLLAVSASVFAQQAPQSPLRFDIRDFEVEGNTLLAPDEIERAIAPFRGGNREFGDLKRAAEALERAYQARGFSAVQVTLPEQDITQGNVRFRVVEQRIGKVTVEGNAAFSESNVRRSLPSILEGEPLNTLKLARELQLAGENPGKQTSVILRAGAVDEQVDVVVKIAGEKLARTFASLDNTGTGETGYYRASIGYQNSNLFDRDHTLTAQYVTSPTHASRVSIFGVGYRIPYYDLHSSLDLFGGYSDVSSGTVQGLFAVSGSGSIAGARWNWYPGKWGDVEQKLSLGLDYRAYRNRVLFQGQGLVPDITVHPASVAYNGVLRSAESALTFNAMLAANIPGGNDGTQADFQNSRTGATSRYVIFRPAVTYERQLPVGWQARMQLNGQYTRNALVSGEQFGLGGPDSVRGYLPREVANDRGYSGQIELYTPDLSPRFSLSTSYAARLVAFYDFGSVKRNFAQPGESTGESIASAGFGMRMTYGKDFSLRVDLAQIIEASANRQAGSLRLGAALLYGF